MGTWSHLQGMDKRDLLRLAIPPPMPSRRCSSTTYKKEGDYLIPGNSYKRQHLEEGWHPCQNAAIAYVYEVAYCAHHLPGPWLTVAQDRKALWAEMMLMVWEQVCAEIPGPEVVEDIP